MDNIEFYKKLSQSSKSKYKWKLFKKELISEMTETMGRPLNFQDALREKLRRLKQ